MAKEKSDASSQQPSEGARKGRKGYYKLLGREEYGTQVGTGPSADAEAHQILNRKRQKNQPARDKDSRR